MIKRVGATLLGLALFVSSAYAQTAAQAVNGFLLAPGGTYNGYTCPSSNVGPCFVQYGSSVPISGSITASLAGFTPGGAYASLTSAGTSSRVGLPTGTVVVAYNTGTTAVSCILGGGSVVAVANEDQIAPGGFFSYTVGSNADLACIDQSGSTSNVIALSGGTGLATGSGGGSGGGGGGAVTIANGADVALGTTGDTSTAGTVVGFLKTIYTDLFGTAGTPSTSVLTIQGIASGTAVAVSSGVAQGSTSSGQSVSPLGVATLSTLPTNTTAQTNLPIADIGGQTVTIPYAPTGSAARGTASETGTSAGTILAASGNAALYEYLTDVQCGRTDAGTTAIYVTFNDGASSVMVLPNSGGGGGNNMHFNIPLRVAKNTAATFTASSGVSTAYCNAQGYYGP